MTERRAKVEPDELPDESLTDGHYLVPDRTAHYLRDVLRLEPGDPVELFDGTGRLLEARVQSCRDDRVRLAILEDRKTRQNESPCTVTLCQALPKRKRWRWVLEKATELGVNNIVPLETDHSVIDIPESKYEGKLERWSRIVGEAARQSERSHTPDIAPPGSIADEKDRPFNGLDLVAHARRDSGELTAQLEELVDDTQTPPIRLWIGPEGGFSPAEIALLEQTGASFFSLGPRILRTETAAIVATTLVQQRLGDLAHH